MTTTLELLDQRARELETLIEELLTQHSGIRVLENDPDSSMVMIGFKNSWEKLNQAGRQLQSRILRELDRYEPLVAALLRAAPAGTRSDAAEASKTLHDAVDQSEGTGHEQPNDVLDDVREAFATHHEHLSGLYDPTPGEQVYVPDANAIIWNPNLEEWIFDESPRFSIVLTSTLLSELDDLKMPHRGESLREKAESAIRRIKEYSRRGDINTGVTLKRDRSTVRMTAVEPDFDNTPGWLDPTVKDDRLIASVLEVVIEHPHSPVVLVTRDVGMQNKARHAGIPFVEPPDPSEGAPARRRKLPDVHVLEIRPQGGNSDDVYFAADVQNQSAQPTRVTFAARIGDRELVCMQPVLDLLANHKPSNVMIYVPRPELGDLVPAFASEISLYGRELQFQVLFDGDVVDTHKWTERLYDADDNAPRYAIQQRVWRTGRGEETEDDLRSEALAQRLSHNPHQHD